MLKNGFLKGPAALQSTQLRGEGWDAMQLCVSLSMLPAEIYRQREKNNSDRFLKSLIHKSLQQAVIRGNAAGKNGE